MKRRIINFMLFVFYMFIVLEQGHQGMFITMCYGFAMLAIMYVLLLGMYLWFELLNEIVKGE